MQHALTKTRKAWQGLLLTGALMAPLAASAQFTVLDQRAYLSAFATSQLGDTAEIPGAPLSHDQQVAAVPRGDLSSQDLSMNAMAGSDFVVQGQASFRSIASSSVVGLSDDIALSFQQVTTPIPSDLYVHGTVSVRGSLTFQVTTPTDVAISGQWGAAGGLGGRIQLDEVLGRVSDGDDNGVFPPYLTKPVAGVNLSGTPTHLAIGTYILSLDSLYSPPSTTSGMVVNLNSDGTVTFGPGVFTPPASLTKVGVSMILTAVPEPATMAMMGLGLVGIAFAASRRTLG